MKKETSLVQAKKVTTIELAGVREGLVLLKGLSVINEAEQEFAAEILRDVKAKHTALEKKRKAITGPLNQVLKEVNDLFRPVRLALEQSEFLLKGKIATFLAECEARNAEALEAAGSAESSEAAEAALAQLSPVAAPLGVSVRYSWVFEITEPEEVPRALWSPDPAKVDGELQAALKRSGRPPEISGVTFTKRPIVTARQVKAH